MCYLSKAEIVIPLFILRLFAAYGYVINAITLFNLFIAAGTEITPMFIGRSIGLCIFPIGAILGYL